MNLQPHPDKLRADAAESALMSSSALDSERRDFFAKIGDHLTTLTSELERDAGPGVLDRRHLRADAAECGLISSLATDSQKRAFFVKIGHHLTALASELEYIAAK